MSALVVLLCGCQQQQEVVVLWCCGGVEGRCLYFELDQAD